MIEVIREKILRVLRHRDYRPMSYRELAKSLEVGEENIADFEAVCEELKKSGHIMLTSGNHVRLAGPKATMEGIFEANAKGFGFVRPMEKGAHEDLFISPDDTNGAMNGDKVRAKVLKKGFRRGKALYSGVVMEILNRGRSRFVATLTKHDDKWLAKPDGSVIVEPVIVMDASSKNVKADDKVIVEILEYPEAHRFGTGVIVEVLGKIGKYDTEIKAVCEQYSLAGDFSDECVEQSRGAADEFLKMSREGRRDITDKTIITIDPESAKDFDDAISIEITRDGNFELGVHIADVSSFIDMESALDVEAKLRGNSTYLPGKTIPMLPEILSNGICSLQPGQERFAKSVYITYDAGGNVIDRNFENSVICSKARLTYEQADAVLKGEKLELGADVIELLKKMNALAKSIEGRRVKKGMLHLDLPETEIIFDEDGQAVDATPADDSYPHTIIEMFMVEANEAVASLFDRFNVPFMRRIHPEPDVLSIKRLSRFVKICGLKLPVKMDRGAMQDILAAVKWTAAEYAVNLYVLRSLEKAEYSPLRIGHFALASENYCHFTSPIRRYADLMVHRILQVYIEGRINQVGIEEVLPDAELKEVGRHITFTEQNSADAEGELKKILVLEMLSEKIGEELEGDVSGLTNYGIFVHCRKYGIEGMIAVDSLGLDEWKYDEKAGALKGKYSGKRLAIGDAIKVKIVSVNVAARHLDLAPSKALVLSRDEHVNGGKRQKRRKRR